MFHLLFPWNTSNPMRHIRNDVKVIFSTNLRQGTPIVGESNRKTSTILLRFPVWDSHYNPFRYDM